MFVGQYAAGRAALAFTDRHHDLAGPVPHPWVPSRARAGSGAGLALPPGVHAVVRAFAGDPLPPVVALRQVHGATVHVLADGCGEPAAAEEPALRGSGDPGDAVVGDGLVTAVPGVVLLVRAADCVPVLLVDPVAGVVGAAHAGRRGLVAGVAAATVARMREAGAEDVTAWLGPHVCGGCYEVSEQMRAEVVRVAPAAYAQTTWSTPALDLGAGVRSQLEAVGVRVRDVGEDGRAGRCTLEDPGLYSYRGAGGGGPEHGSESTASRRQGGLVWLRP